jgi:hypothetical protein
MSLGRRRCPAEGAHEINRTRPFGSRRGKRGLCARRAGRATESKVLATDVCPGCGMHPGRENPRRTGQQVPSRKSQTTAGRPVREMSHGRGAHPMQRRGRRGRISRSAENVGCDSPDTPRCLSGRLAPDLHPTNGLQRNGWWPASPAVCGAARLRGGMCRKRSIAGALGQRAHASAGRDRRSHGRAGRVGGSWHEVCFDAL